METTAYDFTAVVISHGSHGFPHLDALKASNPGLEVVVLVMADTGEEGWRNCDRNLREWWRDNGFSVAPRRVLFLEWDVRVTQDLREVFPARRVVPGCEGAALRTPNRDGRSWPPFQEVSRLPEAMRPHAVGIAPLSVLMVTREALDAVCDAALDAVFAQDIFSELRFPTVMRALGQTVAANAGLLQVTCGPSFSPGPEPGIHHPVKTGGEG